MRRGEASSLKKTMADMWCLRESLLSWKSNNLMIIAVCRCELWISWHVTVWVSDWWIQSVVDKRSCCWSAVTMRQPAFFDAGVWRIWTESVRNWHYWSHSRMVTFIECLMDQLLQSINSDRLELSAKIRSWQLSGLLLSSGVYPLYYFIRQISAAR